MLSEGLDDGFKSGGAKSRNPGLPGAAGNGRVYDPLLAMFLSPDNFIQSPDLTINFNRYSYCLNNPLVYTDPSGDFIFTALAAIFCPALLPVAIAADIGGTINVATHSKNITNFGQFVGYYGIGAAAGAAGAGVGQAVAGAITFGGFAGGALTGAAGGATGGFIGGAGNAWAGGANFGNGLMAGLQGGAFGAVTGGLLGGTIAGIDAARNGGSFWNGKVLEVGGYDGPGTFLDEQIPAGAKPTATGDIATVDGNPDYGEYGWTRKYPNGDLKPHFGVDYSGEVGDDVYAMYDGTVVKVPDGFYKDYGKYAIRTRSLINSKTYYVDYGHLSNNVLSVNQSIRAGDLVGYMGRLGNLANTTFPTHVHIAIWRPILGGSKMGFVKPWWH